MTTYYATTCIGVALMMLSILLSDLKVDWRVGGEESRYFCEHLLHA